jgi:PAS domain S-box-containing protein
MLRFAKSSDDTARDERLRAAFAAAPVGLALAGLDGRLLLFNDTAAQLLGYSREELGRVTLQDITHPEDLQRETAYIRKITAGEVNRYQIEKRVADKQGKYRPLMQSAALVRRKGDRDALVYVIHPPQRKTESGSTADELSHLILEGLAETAIIRCDPAGVILGWNRGAQEMFGYTHDEIIRRNRWQLYRRAENWSAVAAEHLRVAAEAGSFETEDWRVTRDGRELWVRVTLTAFAPDGVVRGYVEVINPIVQTAAANEEVIAHLREELERERDASATLTRIIEKMKTKRVELEQELAVWTPLDQRKALDVVEEMARERRTGLLLFVSEGRQKSVQFAEGRIASCASNDDEQSFGERLVRVGAITEAQRDQALEVADKTNIALGRALVLLETLAEEVVVAALREKLANELADLETWTSGRWTFVEREPPRGKPVKMSVPVEDAREPR